MRLERERVLAISFIFLSAVSALYLSAATLNYLNYFPAVGHLQVQIEKVSAVQGSNWSRVDSHMIIMNPSDYSGFRLAGADEHMHFLVNGTNTTLFSPDSLQVVQVISGELGPRSTVAADVIIQLSPQNASSLASLNSNNPGRVVASVQMTVDIITFLNPVLGHDQVNTSADLALFS